MRERAALFGRFAAGRPEARIGQDNDGPWGGLPEWLGAATWFTFLASVLAILAGT